MEQTTDNVLGVQFDQQSFLYLSQAGKWAKFLAVMGFIMCALLLLAGIFVGVFLGSNMNMMGPVFASLGGAVITVIYVLIALVYIFPCVFLFRFASNMKGAIDNHDGTRLNVALHNLKRFFKFIGILIIIFLSFYVVALILAGAAAMMSR